MNPLLLALQIAAAGPASTGLPAAGLQGLTATRIDIAMRIASEEAFIPERKSTLRTTKAGNMVRTEEVASTGPAFSKVGGSYTLMLDGGKRAYTVDTVRKEYSEFNIAKLSTAMSQAVGAMGSMNPRFSNMKVDVRNLGPGVQVKGHRTTHWRATHSMTMSTMVGGDSSSFTSENVNDLYYANDLAALQNPASVVDSVGNIMPFQTFLTGENLKTLVTEMGKLPKATPIRSVMVTTMSVGPTDITTTVTSEVTDIASVVVPRSFFEIPKGYKLVEMQLPTSVTR